MNTRELLGNPVSDRLGRRLGTVEEIVVERLSGRISFAVVSLDDGDDSLPGFLPVPWSALRQEAHNDGLRLVVSESRVAEAPRIARDELDALERREVGVQVFSYYGLQPPWENAASGTDDQGDSHTHRGGDSCSNN